MLWWKLPIPSKIIAFMWLMSRNKILTMKRLQSKGWRGDPSCHFCREHESNKYLSFGCFFAKQVWFWMGKCQKFFINWHSINDALDFALTLFKTKRTAFLLVVSVVIWRIWRQRNDICFNNAIIYSCKNTILIILSCIHYWLGLVSEEVKNEVKNWLLTNLDDIPLQVADPEDV